MQEKTTKENNREPGGLNEGNPNTDRTPIDPIKLPNLTGGSKQANYEDEQRGDADTKNAGQDPERMKK